MNKSERELSEGYERCAQAMLAAARSWLVMRPGVVIAFNGLPKWVLDKAPPGIPEDKIAVAAGIPQVLAWWPANADTRALLEHMDKAGNYEGTYMQAKVVIQMLHQEAPQKGGTA